MVPAFGGAWVITETNKPGKISIFSLKWQQKYSFYYMENFLGFVFKNSLWIAADLVL